MKSLDKRVKEKVMHEITDVVQAVEFLEWAKYENGSDSTWSIQYYGFGEHFTHWAGDGTFIDFEVDRGTGISWRMMSTILIESANNLRELIKREYQERITK